MRPPGPASQWTTAICACRWACLHASKRCTCRYDACDVVRVPAALSAGFRVDAPASYPAAADSTASAMLEASLPVIATGAKTSKRRPLFSQSNAVL
jgi:hypothetical protein